MFGLSPFKEGYRARFKGKTLDDCPYVNGIMKSDWIEGWNLVQDKIEKRQQKKKLEEN